MALTKTRAVLVQFLRNNYAETWGSVAEARMNRALDNALRRLRVHHWSFLTGKASIGTTAPVSTGTCNIASFSARTTVSFSGVTLPTDIVGQYIEINNERGWYEITARNSATSITIERPYTGAMLDVAAGTATTYRILYPMADLPPNFRRLVKAYRMPPDDPLRYIPTPGAWWLQAWFSDTADPDRYGIVQGTQDPNQIRLLLYPAPVDNRAVVQIVYTRDPGWFSTNVPPTATWKREATADTDYLDWPDRHMDLFYKAALVSLYEEDDKEGKLGVAVAAYKDAEEACQRDDNPNGMVGQLSSGLHGPGVIDDVEIESAEYL